MDRPELSATIMAELARLFAETLQRDAAYLLASDLDGIEQRLQDITRAVFGPVVQQTIRTIAATLPSDPPHNLKGERPMRPVAYARPRSLQGLAGDYRIVRPYFLCDRCHHGCASLDEQLGVAAGMVSRGLARVVCRLGFDDSFGDAVNALDETLRIPLTGEAARWVIEGIGQVVETEPEAAIALAQAGQEPLPNYAEIYEVLRYPSLVSIGGMLNWMLRERSRVEN